MNKNIYRHILIGGDRLLVIAVLMALALFAPAASVGVAAPAATTIGGCIYTGARDANGNALINNPPAYSASPIVNAQVMVQNQHSGGAFITYGTVDAAGCWTAMVDDGDYVVMFSAPDHDLTSREVTVAGGAVTHPRLLADGTIVTSTDPLAIDAYLPPLYTSFDGTPSTDELPTANLLVYSFYDNQVNGEDDAPDDPPLNGVTWTAKDEEGNVLATGVTGSQSTITLADGTIICDNATNPGACDGLYYFTGLPPGEVIATSDPSTAYLYDVDGPSSLGPVINPVTGAALNFDASTEFYLMTSEEGGPAWDPKLYPGDPGTEAGGYLLWHGYVEKLGQIGDPTNPTPYNPAITGTISGTILDADGNDPEEPFPVPGPPGVSPNTIVPDSFIVLFTDHETVATHPVATTEADPVTGEYSFVNVPPGRYKMFVSDIPIDYVWVQQAVTVLPNFESTASPMVPRFFARGQGYVYDDSTGLPMAGVDVHIRYKDGSIQTTETTDVAGWYNFDDLPEIEVLGYVDVELPPNYRGAMKTDTFSYNLPAPVDVTHNAMNRYIQWYTANYRADLYLEPIPATEGDLRGFVFNDHLARGTWVGDGVYDPEEERTMHGVTVELWDATGTTLLATTTTGQFDKAATLAQGWVQPYSVPPDEFGGVYVGPLPGFYEFRGLAPGTYMLKVIPPAGFSPSPAGSDVVTVTVAGGLGTEVNFGVNTLVPLAGEIEGGVFDDLNIDPNATSSLFMEKAGLPGVPVGIYDHLGYLLGVGYMGDPQCNPANNLIHTPGDTTDPFACSDASQPEQKPEMERRFAPGVHIYFGNDPSFAGYNPNYVSLVLAYTFGQGKFKFEADWSLPPVAFLGIGAPLAGKAPILPAGGPVIDNVAPGGSWVITGWNFGDTQEHSTVTLAGKELQVISWSDTEIHARSKSDDPSGPVLVTTAVGPSNGVHLDTGYIPVRSVFVDASNTGPEDGSQANPWSTITEALNHLPNDNGTKYVFVAPGTYYERVRIAEPDVYLIGAGPLETIIDGRPGAPYITAQGFSNGSGPVVTLGPGGGASIVQNVKVSGFTITGGTVTDRMAVPRNRKKSKRSKPRKEDIKYDHVSGDTVILRDIGAGIFSDYGNFNIDINNNLIVRNGGYYGGGIWLHKSNHDVRIWSNTIAENGNFGGYGGAISVNDEPEYGSEHGEPEHVWDDPCPPTCTPPGTYEIFNNHIFHNFSPDYGGAIALYEVKDHLKVFGNLIEENKADDHGGGAFFEDTGPIEIYENTFLRNYSRDDGGAISFEDVGDDIATVMVYNNLFAENMADDCGENHARGGALAFDDTFYGKVYNNTIVDNIVAGSLDPAGGGIDSERNGHEYNGSDPDGRDIAPGYSDPMIYNNIIWGNMRLQYEQPGGGEEEDLCYEWGINPVSTPDDLHVDNPALQAEWESQNNSESFTHVEYNNISDGQYSSRIGNISADPQFSDPSLDDWHLQLASPVIAQAPAATSPTVDRDVLPRVPQAGMVDMGAFEFQVPLGDVDGDCDVDVADMAAVASRWGLTQGDPNYLWVYDVDEDGTIGLADIQAVAAQWRQTCK